MSREYTRVEAKRLALQRGADAEAWVAERLQREGWEVLARNWRAAGGELDLVVSRAGAVRFVEVKARHVGDPTGLESVGFGKQARLIRAADAWLLAKGEPESEACFLVAVVSLGSPWTVEWFDDAFDGS